MDDVKPTVEKIGEESASRESRFNIQPSFTTHQDSKNSTPPVESANCLLKETKQHQDKFVSLNYKNTRFRRKGISTELITKMIKDCPVPIKKCSVQLVDVMKDSDTLTSGKLFRAGESLGKRKSNSSLTNDYLYKDEDIVKVTKFKCIFRCKLDDRIISLIAGPQNNKPKHVCMLCKFILPPVLNIIVNDKTMNLDMSIQGNVPAYVERLPSSRSVEEKEEYFNWMKRRKENDIEGDLPTKELEKQINEYLLEKLESMFKNAQMGTAGQKSSKQSKNKFGTNERIYVRKRKQREHESQPISSGIRREFKLTDSLQETLFKTLKLDTHNSVGNNSHIYVSMDNTIPQNTSDGILGNMSIKQEPLEVQTSDKHDVESTSNELPNTASSSLVMPLWNSLTNTSLADSSVTKSSVQSTHPKKPKHVPIILKTGTKYKKLNLPLTPKEISTDKNATLSLEPDTMEHKFSHQISSLVKRIQEKVLRDLKNDFSNGIQSNKNKNTETTISYVKIGNDTGVVTYCPKQKRAGSPLSEPRKTESKSSMMQYGQPSGVKDKTILSMMAKKLGKDSNTSQINFTQICNTLPTTGDILKSINNASASTQQNAYMPLQPNASAPRQLASSSLRERTYSEPGQAVPASTGQQPFVFSQGQPKLPTFPMSKLSNDCAPTQPVTSTPRQPVASSKGLSIQSVPEQLTSAPITKVVLPSSKGFKTQGNSNPEVSCADNRAKNILNNISSTTLSKILLEHGVSSNTNTFYKFCVDDKLVLIPSQSISENGNLKAIVIDTKRMADGTNVHTNDSIAGKNINRHDSQGQISHKEYAPENVTKSVNVVSGTSDQNTSIPSMTPVQNIQYTVPICSTGMNVVQQFPQSNIVDSMSNSTGTQVNVMPNTWSGLMHSALLLSLAAKAKENDVNSNNVSALHGVSTSLTVQSTGLANSQTAQPFVLNPNNTVLSNDALTVPIGLANISHTFKSQSVDQYKQHISDAIRSTGNVCISLNSTFSSFPVVSQPNNELLNTPKTSASQLTSLTSLQTAMPFVLYPNIGMSNLSLMVPIVSATQNSVVLNTVNTAILSPPEVINNQSNINSSGGRITTEQRQSNASVNMPNVAIIDPKMYTKKEQGTSCQTIDRQFATPKIKPNGEWKPTVEYTCTVKQESVTSLPSSVTTAPHSVSASVLSVSPTTVSASDKSKEAPYPVAMFANYNVTQNSRPMKSLLSNLNTHTKCLTEKHPNGDKFGSSLQKSAGPESKSMLLNRNETCNKSSSVTESNEESKIHM